MHTDLFAVAQALRISQSLIAERGLTVCTEARDLELVEVGTDGGYPYEPWHWCFENSGIALASTSTVAHPASLG